MELYEMYASLGVSRAVWEYGERILEGLQNRFAAIDRTAEYNQAKVLRAMHQNRVDATCFAATTGYGYDDLGREKLERVYAAAFGTEAALVRPQITCGTHALAVALSAQTCCPATSCSAPSVRRMTRWRRSSASARPNAR